MSTDFKELNEIESLNIRNAELELAEVAARNKCTQLEVENHTLKKDKQEILKWYTALQGDVLFASELQYARCKFPAMASAHEGYAVILEELDEVWEIIKQKRSERDYVALRKETIQLGAMVLGFLIEIVDTNNRR